MAIIALLVSILLPSLKQARKQTQRMICASNQRQQSIGFFFYQYDYKLLPSSMVYQLDVGYPIGSIGGSGGLYALNGAVGKALMDDFGLADPKIWSCTENTQKPRMLEGPFGPGDRAGDTSMFFADMYNVLTYLDGSVYPALSRLHDGALSAAHLNESTTA